MDKNTTINMLRQALDAWNNYRQDHPGPAWVLDYLLFVLEIQERLLSGMKISSTDRGKLKQIAPLGGIGPLAGFAGRDLVDPDLREHLINVEYIAKGLRRKLFLRRFT